MPVTTLYLRTAANFYLINCKADDIMAH